MTTRGCCTIALTLFIFSSCSKIFHSKKSEPLAVETTLADSVVKPVVTVAQKEIKPTIIDSAKLADSLAMADSIAEAERYYYMPLFTEDQETSARLPEYKSLIVNDLKIDLSDERNKGYYPADGHQTSPYGWRHGRMHSGVDIKAYKGDDIHAAYDGVVRMAKYYGAYGNCVIIRHYNGLETLYGHATKLLVEPNQKVKAGEVIALAGSTGRSTGSHLHFEVRINGNCLDPNMFINTKDRTMKEDNVYITMRSGRLFASNNDNIEVREAQIMAVLSVKYHIVRSGDVLSRIAANNHTTVSKICRMNGISSRSTLRIGQRLKVRDGIVPPKKTTTAAVASTTTAAPKKEVTKAPTATRYYTVKSGDTLSEIAERNGTTITKLCSMNNITRRTTLRIGQRLALDGSASASSKSSSSYHIVRSGDTLSVIASRNHTTVANICRLNNISKTSTLRIGQKLRLS